MSISGLPVSQGDSREATDSRGPRWLPALVAALVSVVIYGVTIRGTFVLDDEAFARDDVRLLSPRASLSLWTSQYVPHALDHTWRPLLSLSYAIHHWTTGKNPMPFHAANILLFAATAAAVAEFVRRLVGLRTAWVAGLLFAALPAHVEAVALVVGRAETECALAMLCGLCLFLKQPLTGGRIVGILACYLLALLTKEHGLLFPIFLLALWPVWRQRARQSGLQQRRQLQWLAAGVFWVMAVYGIYREEMIGFPWNLNKMYWTYNPIIRSTGWDRVLMPVALFGRYLALLVFPAKLSPDYGTLAIGWQIHASDPHLYVGIVGILTWIVLLAIGARRRNWRMLFCLVGFAASLLLVLNVFIINAGAIFGERLAFVPSIFFVILVAMALARLPIRALAPIVGVLVVAGGVRSFAYARQWNDPLTFLDRASEAQPKSWVLYDFRYEQYKLHGDWKGARRVAEEAIAALPQIPTPYVREVEACVKLHDFPAARKAMAQGKTIVPPSEFPWTMMDQMIQDAQAKAGAMTRPDRP